MKKLFAAMAAALVAAGAMAQAIDLVAADREIADAKIATGCRNGMMRIQDGEQVQDNVGLTYQVISVENKVCAVIDYDQNLEQTSVEVPSAIIVDGVQFAIVEIGPFAFNQSTLLREILLPRTLKYIDEFAFANCQNLRSLEIPESVVHIGQYAFYLDMGLTRVSIPAGLAELSAYTFANCTSLNSIELPEGLTKIGECAFHHCNSLKAIKIGKNVKEIVNNPFGDCWELAAITVDPENPVYCDIDGVVFTKDKKTLVAYSDGHGETYVVPNGVEKIGDFAFYYSEYLEQITLPESLVEIGVAAFMYSNEMTSFHVPAGVKSIGIGAFYKADNIATFTVDAANTHYRAYSGVLYNKAGTVLVAYPGARAGEYKALASTYAVADYAFAGCKIERIVLPAACELVGSFAFARSAVSVVDMPGVTDIYDQAFYFCYYYNNVVLPPSIQVLGDEVYKDCARIERIISYAPTAPKCGYKVFDDMIAGMPLGVLVGCAQSYRASATFSKMKISESFYKVTSECDAAKGTVNINGQGPTAYLETWQDAEVTIAPIGDNKVAKVLVNGVDYTNELQGDYLYLPAAGVNLIVKVVFDTDDSIESLEADAAEAEYYSLSGVKVDNPGAGVYIKAQRTAEGVRCSKVVF